MIDNWGSALTGLGTTRERSETDDELRARLRYVAADGQRLTHEIEAFHGDALDELAGNFGLSRRRVR